MKDLEQGTAAEKAGAEQKKRKSLRIVLIGLCVVLAAVFAVSLYMVIDYYRNANEEQGIIDRLKDYAASESEREAAARPTLPSGSGGSGAVSGDGRASDGGGAPFVSQYAALHDINPDYVGWLYMEGTLIDYPVMYSPYDIEYYSRRTVFGADSRGGTPFIGPDADIDSDCFYIYGHNMSSGLFFGTLHYYEDPEFVKEHPRFTFETLTERRTYEIFGVLKTIVRYEGNGFLYYGYPGEMSEDRFDEFVENIKKESIVECDVEPEFGDQLLVVSTCSYHTPTGRFVVVGRRIE